MTTKRWLGNAAATFDVWTISLSGTVVSQTYSVTINSKSVTYTASGADTVASILAALVANITSLTLPAPPEFGELTWAVSGTTIVATGNTAGKPSIITVATSGAATFTITNTTPATGPNDFTNGQNWSGGVAPANADTLVFDNGNVPCKYNINSTLTGITLLVYPAFSGTIGLPFINSDNNTTYAEYRTASLTLAGGTVTINAPNCKRCNLAFGSNTTTVTVTGSGARIDQYTPPILIIGGNGSSVLNISKGDVGLAFYQGQSATFATIQASYQTSALADVTLFCGPGCTLTTITKNGGTLTTNSNITTLTQGVGGGTTTIVAGAVTTAYCENGSLIYNSAGALGTVTVAGKGILDFTQSPVAKTITNPILAYGDNYSVLDSYKTVNSGVLSVTTEQTTQINVNHGSGSAIVFT